MDAIKWDYENNIIDTSIKLPTQWAYALNTNLGRYEMRNELVHVEDVCSFNITRYNIVLISDNETKEIIKDVSVWAHRYYSEFMIFHIVETGQVYLIDSRGIIFDLEFSINKQNRYGYGYIEKDKRLGYYLIKSDKISSDGVKIKFRTKDEQKEFNRLSKPSVGVKFNKKFNKFVRDNAKNTKGYLYLTAGNNKCGGFVSYFVKNGMTYEEIPNMLEDDETLNIRILLNESSLSRLDVQFLLAKYENTYSIYGIPIFAIGGGLIFPERYKEKYYSLKFYMPKGREPIIYSIIDTLRIASGANDDYDVYKKSLSKVLRLFERGTISISENKFLANKLKYPNGYCGVSKEYIIQNLDYINELLENINEKKIDGLCLRRSKCNFYKDGSKIKRLYDKAYEQSKINYKQVMSEYEADTVSKMAQLGIKTSRWKNESDLYLAVLKLYPDAIYQYHSDWLKLQSLDIYIPSINVGIEYQGEQHYRPIDFFGGKIGYRNTLIRDEKKRQLCENQGVELIYWKYDEVINKAKVVEKLLQS